MSLGLKGLIQYMYLHPMYDMYLDAVCTPHFRYMYTVTATMHHFDKIIIVVDIVDYKFLEDVDRVACTAIRDEKSKRKRWESQVSRNIADVQKQLFLKLTKYSRSLRV